MNTITHIKLKLSELEIKAAVARQILDAIGTSYTHAKVQNRKWIIKKILENILDN